MIIRAVTMWCLYSIWFLARTGYDPSEPAETSAKFAGSFPQNSYAGRIRGADFAAASGSNAQFTVEAWAESFADNTNCPGCHRRDV